MRLRTTLAAAGLAGCAGGADADRWRTERLLWEGTPVSSAAEARAAADALSAKGELGLEDCWRLAIHRSETLAMDLEEIRRLEALYGQAVAAVLPRVVLQGSYSRQDTAGVSSSAFTLGERTEWKVTGRQPLFSGFREFFAIRQARALREAREHDVRRARLALYGNVAEAFYAALQAEREMETTAGSLRLAKERLVELRAREGAGISRRSETLAQEAEAAAAAARLVELRGALAVSWETLRFLTGLRGPKRLADATPLPGSLPAVDAAAERAAAGRSDIQALEREADAAEEAVRVARAGHWPTVRLEGNWYLHREGISEDVDWDVAVIGELPLFEGGGTEARIRDAESSLRTARLRLERLRREAGLEVRRTHADLLAHLAALDSLERRVASASEHSEIAEAEYRQGIVTNLEVLRAFQERDEALLARDRARFQAKVAAVRLAVAEGRGPGGSA